jgi:hypothetical protein
LSARNRPREWCVIPIFSITHRDRAFEAAVTDTVAHLPRFSHKAHCFDHHGGFHLRELFASQKLWVPDHVRAAPKNLLGAGSFLRAPLDRRRLVSAP